MTLGVVRASPGHDAGCGEDVVQRYVLWPGTRWPRAQSATSALSLSKGEREPCRPGPWQVLLLALDQYSSIDVTAAPTPSGPYYFPAHFPLVAIDFSCCTVNAGVCRVAFEF